MKAKIESLLDPVDHGPTNESCFDRTSLANYIRLARSTAANAESLLVVPTKSKKRIFSPNKMKELIRKS